jgi:signal transduction histidine kinase
MWLAAVVAALGALILAALILPRSFALTAFSDIVQCFLLLSGTIVFIPLILHSQGRIRLFWSLVALGGAFWLIYQLFWTYYEIILRASVPDLCSWDVVLFLHIVPMMAALALRPQVPRDEYSARVGQLDFALLLLWWLYVYVLIVMPWQYVVPDAPAYARDLNNVYAVEKLVLLAGLVASYITSKGGWKKVFAALFCMSFCYSASSTIANWALARKTYYSGSLYDIPLVISMASLTWIGLQTKVETAETSTPEASTAYGVWVARSSMIAVFSLPIFAAWAMSDSLVPYRIRAFRLALTLMAAFLMGTLVFVRQRMLDRELIRLLNHSRESFSNLKRLQAQILQSEKVASIGQLVGGVAHEINNPLTAMLGYSDLLLSTALTPNQQPLAAKIGHYVRRTKSLVGGLINFARQSPGIKAPFDLNALIRTAVKLTQIQWERLHIEVRARLDTSLPKILGDSNQMLLVCLQLIENCLYAMSESGGKVLSISTEKQAGNCVLRISATAPASLVKPDAGDCSSIHALGLSTCQGILQEHQGLITQEHDADSAFVLIITLPAAESAYTGNPEAMGSILWQSQPYA